MDKTPYDTIGEIVESCGRSYGCENMLATISLRYDYESEPRLTTEILEYEFDPDRYIWHSDWWEGEQNVELIGYAPLSKIILHGDGDGRGNEDGSKLYPVTIIEDRYTGAYSGGKWTAFNRYADDIPEEVDDSDVPCFTFWWSTNKEPVGIGNTPDEALRDLEEKIENSKGENI